MIVHSEFWVNQRLALSFCRHKVKSNEMLWVCWICQSDETDVLRRSCFLHKEHDGVVGMAVSVIWMLILPARKNQP